MTEKIRVLKILHLAICGGTILIYALMGLSSLEQFGISSISSKI